MELGVLANYNSATPKFNKIYKEKLIKITKDFQKLKKDTHTMNKTIKINDIDLIFNDEEITYTSPTENKTITFNKDDKNLLNALMQIINLIEFKNSNTQKEKI